MNTEGTIFGKYRTELNRPGDWIQPAYLRKTRKSKGYAGSRELFPKRKQNSVENFLRKPCFAVEGIEISFTIIGYILQNFWARYDGLVMMIRK
jgi:hypothetical protein